MSDDTRSIVYVLTNPAMPGLVKIGLTSADSGTRIAQLYTTGVPVPFKVEFACRVEKPAEEVEKALHEAFGPSRINPKREFFRIEPEQAIVVLRLLGQDATAEIAAEDAKSVDPQDAEAAERLRKRRPNLNFDEMGIPVGSTLRSNRNDDTARVVGPKKVEFKGEEMSLSAATQRMRGTDYPLAPGPYWTLEGKPLQEIYEETYGED